MTDPLDAIAAKLIEAAYEVHRRPPEAGGALNAASARQRWGLT